MVIECVWDNKEKSGGHLPFRFLVWNAGFCWSCVHHGLGAIGMFCNYRKE
jgi:hypothetical protein